MVINFSKVFDLEHRLNQFSVSNGINTYMFFRETSCEKLIKYVSKCIKYVLRETTVC